MRVKRGFSLIEVLVVVVIIAISASIGLLAFGDFGQSRQVRASVERLVAYIQLVQQRARLTNTAWGINCTKNGFSTYYFAADNEWQLMRKPSFFYSRLFPRGVRCVSAHQSVTPHIIIDSIGDLSSFEFDFGTRRQPVLTMLRTNEQGQLVWLNNGAH